jgi:hypothetical protein
LARHNQLDVGSSHRLKEATNTASSPTPGPRDRRRLAPRYNPAILKTEKTTPGPTGRGTHFVLVSKAMGERTAHRVFHFRFCRAVLREAVCAPRVSREYMPS